MDHEYWTVRQGPVTQFDFSDSRTTHKPELDEREFNAMVTAIWERVHMCCNGTDVCQHCKPVEPGLCVKCWAVGGWCGECTDGECQYCEGTGMCYECLGPDGTKTKEYEELCEEYGVDP